MTSRDVNCVRGAVLAVADAANLLCAESGYTTACLLSAATLGMLQGVDAALMEATQHSLRRSVRGSATMSCFELMAVMPPVISYSTTRWLVPFSKAKLSTSPASDESVSVSTRTIKNCAAQAPEGDW